VAQAAAVQLTALPRQHEQRRVHEQLFEEVRARVRGVGDAVALRGLDALSVAEGDVANVRSETEDRFS
jgi:hypothetical protein